MSIKHSVDSRALKQTIALDALKRGASVSEAAEVAGVSRRTINNWAEKDPRGFGELKAEAARNRGRVVTEGQVKDWQQELADAEAELATIDAKLLDAAAPALAGDESAGANQSRLGEEREKVSERIAVLKAGLASAEAHLERARQQEAEAACEAAADEAGEHSKAQAAAAAKIDKALTELGVGWDEFVAASAARQSAARRSGGRARAAYSSMLIQAVFANCLSVADALGLDRRLRTRARTLSETVV